MNVGQVGSLGKAGGPGYAGNSAGSGPENHGVIQALLQALPTLQSSMQDQPSMAQTAGQVNGILGRTLGGLPQGAG